MSSEPSVQGAYGAVVFDFDGTLIDSNETKTRNYVSSFERIFGTGHAERERIADSFRRTCGANRFLQLQDTLSVVGRTAAAGQDEEWSRLYSNLNAESLSRIPEFPSVQPLLKELREAGYKLYAASGVLEEELRRELNRRGLSSFFLEIHGGDKLGVISEMVHRGVPNILFVGDTEYDRRTALEAGVSFYLVQDDRDLQALRQRLVERS
jgi:phosphoglycolate phosphatase-like HAD superfamily hydrolase